MRHVFTGSNTTLGKVTGDLCVLSLVSTEEDLITVRHASGFQLFPSDCLVMLSFYFIMIQKNIKTISILFCGISYLIIY